MTDNQNKFHYINEAHGKVWTLVRLRLPWLIIGLLGGTAASFIVSRFEDILSKNIQLAFFIPMIVYMSDAVGTQTETIFVRNLEKIRSGFSQYLMKELFIGMALGVFLGLLIALIARVWLGSNQTALIVGLAMFCNVTVAPLVAVIIPELLFKERSDPALGAGPISTVIQDFISLFIYFVIATAILSFGIK